MKILIADDEKLKRVTLADDLAAQGHDVAMAEDGQDAWQQIEASSFDVVVTDLKMPRLDGLELLKRIKSGPRAGTQVIVMTAYGSIPVAIEAIRLGAFDFVTKPFRNEDLLPLLARIGRTTQADRGPDDEVEDLDQVVIGTSEAMGQVKRMIHIAARSDANVLLCGETGVGKDLIASAIHRISHRCRFPLVKVGCTLLPSNLIESELYGHEPGSFTGAEKQRQGRFALAEGGTVYLDDVDDIPLAMQSKLLRAIEEKVYERVGGTTPIQADVRVVASTKVNLLDRIAEETFRQDLYYRLDVLRVTIPPLRERRGDLPALIDHLLRRVADGGDAEIDSEAVEKLCQHDWPGNVRELYHTLERAYLVGAGHVRVDGLHLEAQGPKGSDANVGTYQATMAETERQLLVRALEAAGGNKTAAAAALDIKPSTFRDKLAKHGLG